MNSNMDEYIKHALIVPPQPGSTEPPTKKTRIVIDSKDRDCALFPDPNEYTITFDDDIDDVLTVQLINADIPMSMYLVNKYFDTLDVVVNGSSYEMKLRNGDFDEPSLATMIQNQMNTYIADTFNVTYDAVVDKYTFLSKTPFTFDFSKRKKSGSMHYMLGFRPKEYNSISSNDATYPYKIEADFRKNFEYNNCVIMNIEQLDINKSPTNVMNKSFAVISKKYKDLNMSDDPSLIKFLTPPIPHLMKLRISFKDRFGNDYDFQNKDHRFELMFTSLRQKTKYLGIFNR